MHDFMYNNFSDFATFQNSTTDKSITRFYNEMSMGNFHFYGDCFKNPTTGKPESVEIDPTGTSDLGDCNLKAMQKLKGLYPNYDFSSYDNRTNFPNYLTDNSFSSPDNKIDYLVFIYRFDYDWLAPNKTALNPLPSGFSTTGLGGGYADVDGLSGFTWNGYTFNAGFTFGYGPAVSNPLGLFLHEVSHSLYNMPHVMGANSVPGERFKKLSQGWGMMKGNGLNMCANSWEKYILGWINLECGVTHDNSDIQSATDLNLTGKYHLRDNVKYGDVIRIKIPHTTNQYLWIENHQNISNFDHSEWAGGHPKQNDIVETIGDADKGIYMFVEQMLADRQTQPQWNGNSVNGLMPILASGNFDFSRSSTPDNGINLWGNPLYEVTQQNENIFAGRHCKILVPDDLNNDNTIRYDHGTWNLWNNGGIYEGFNISKEIINSSPELTYREWGGLNQHSNGIFHSQSFGLNDGVGINDIAPAVNSPLYDFSNEKYYPTLLNGLSVKVTGSSILSDGSEELEVTISFNDNTITKDRRWCGNLEIPNGQSFIIKQNKSVILEKSGTVDRLTKNANGDFISTTMLNLDNNSTVEIENQANLIIKDNSVFNASSGCNLIIDGGGKVSFESSSVKSYFRTGSNIQLLSNSKIFIKNGSILEIEPNANVTIEDGASIVVEPNSKLILGDGQVFLNGSNASVYIKGILEIPTNTDLTLNGTGFYQFGVGNNILLGQSSKVNIIGGSRNYHNIIKIDDNAKMMVQNHNVKLEQGRIVYGLNSKIEVNGGGTLEMNNLTTVNYGVTAPYKGESAIDVSNTHNVLITNCIIDDFVDGVKVHDYALDCIGYNGKPFVKIENCNFNLNGNSDIKVNNMQNTNVLIQGCTLANQNNYGDNGLDLSHCNKVELISSIISNKKRDGIKAENVNQLLVNSTHIFSNLSNGIEANNANVYVRNGSVVELNVNDGISLNNGGNTLANATSSLTIGDWGCAWIIHNGGYAINGSDFFLYADAREHSILNGSNVKPNRFDDNSINTGTGMSINICYTFPFWNDKANEVIISSTTLRQNYWGGSNYRYIGHVGFQPSPSGGIGCNFLIPNLPSSFLDDGGFLTSLPVSTGACTFTTFDPNEVAPYDPTNISGRMSHTPVEIPQELIDATLASEEPAGKIFSMAYRKMLGDNIDEATFMLTDYLSVADPSVMPDSRFETTQALADKLAIQLYALDPCTSPYEPIPNSSRVIKRNQIKQAIAAKALKNSSSTGIKIFPNPFESSTTVSFTNEAKETFVCTVYNMQGQSVKTMQNIESNSFTIDASMMPKGMYWIELKSKTKSYREKLVVE